MTIDTHLDAYATERIGGGKRYCWWWNGCYILADAIASLAGHVRNDGCHVLSDAERDELETLERYMSNYEELEFLVERDCHAWLHAEAMWLLARWFPRLWD